MASASVPTSFDRARAIASLRRELIERMEGGHWSGRLCSSALATATAISALAWASRSPQVDSAARRESSQRVDRGMKWLAAAARPDGGFGDTDRSHSNIATTLLAIAAIHAAGRVETDATLLARAEAYVDRCGGLAALADRYGRDRTFAVPILTNAALAGFVDWRQVPPLPFELACFPQTVYRWLRMPVVSYAIPALVAIGQARFFHRPPRFPLLRWVRRWAIPRSLGVLERMQPESGGYLEAIPLTSFVAMALVQTGRGSHPVVTRGVGFLFEAQRADGSWPIDTNLATWLTSLAMGALTAGGGELPAIDVDWLLSCQNARRHPFTGAAAGGWGWSELSGAVPDADDTPAALLALAAAAEDPRRASDRGRIERAARLGCRWLLGLQNRDGGWPTFCRGWGRLPFDRSGSDLTAHAIRGLRAWRHLDRGDFARAVRRGERFLFRTQSPDGSWRPLWFGNQDEADESNPVYGTARVLRCLCEGGAAGRDAVRRGVRWLLDHQHDEGGWGGGPSTTWPDATLGYATIEETAAAVDGLSGITGDPAVDAALDRGCRWLVRAVENGYHRVASPIGFYFAKLWYYEDLYPLIFSLSALARAAAR